MFSYISLCKTCDPRGGDNLGSRENNMKLGSGAIVQPSIIVNFFWIAHNNFRVRCCLAIYCKNTCVNARLNSVCDFQLYLHVSCAIMQITTCNRCNIIKGTNSSFYCIKQNRDKWINQTKQASVFSAIAKSKSRF